MEAVALSELTTEVAATEFEVAETVELATEVEPVELTARLLDSELCGASDVDTAGVLEFATSLVATGAELVALVTSDKAASPPKSSAAVAG